MEGNRTVRREKRSRAEFLSLDGDSDEREMTKAKSLQRRSRSQSISARARQGPSSKPTSRRGSSESIDMHIGMEEVKYHTNAFSNTEAFSKPRQPTAHYESDSDSVPSERQLEEDIQKLKQEKEELEKTRLQLNEQMQKLAQIQTALDIEKESNEKNIGEAIRMNDRAHWLEQEVEARDMELRSMEAEKDKLLKEMGRMSVEEKGAEYEIERMKKEIEKMAKEAAEWEHEAIIAREKAASNEQTEIVRKSQKVFESADAFTREAYDDLAKSKSENDELNRVCTRMEMELTKVKQELLATRNKNINLEDKVGRLRHFHTTASREDLTKIRANTSAGSVTSSQGVPLSQIQSKGENKDLLMVSEAEPPKKLKTKDFPLLNNFADFSEYISTMRNYVKALLNLGYDDKSLARDMVLSIASSKVGSTFLHELQKRNGCNAPDSVTETISILEQCDFEYSHRTPEERFRNLRKGTEESMASFLKRCEQSYDELNIPNAGLIWRLREIKNRFLEGSQLPLWVRDKLAPYSDLSEMLFACQGLVDRNLQWRQNNQNQSQNQNQSTAKANQDKPQQKSWNKGAYGQKKFFQQQPQQQSDGGVGTQTQQQDQATAMLMEPVIPQYRNENGTVSFRPPIRERVPAPSGTARAHTNAEEDMAYKFRMCMNCRALDTHPVQVCCWQSYCSICNMEGSHTDNRCYKRNADASMQTQA